MPLPGSDQDPQGCSAVVNILGLPDSLPAYDHSAGDLHVSSPECWYSGFTGAAFFLPEALPMGAVTRLCNSLPDWWHLLLRHLRPLLYSMPEGPLALALPSLFFLLSTFSSFPPRHLSLLGSLISGLPQPCYQKEHP